MTSDSARLTDVVHGVRDRWRLKRALRGTAIVLAAAFVLLAASALVLDGLHYGHNAVLVVRTIVLLAVAGLAAVLVVVPLLPKRKPSDHTVALYLEEHEPSLDAAVLTAVELQEREARTDELRRRGPISPSLRDQLTHSALERVHTIDDGRHVDERELHVSAGLLAGVLGVALLTTLLGPASLRHGMGLMLVPWDRTPAANVFAISAEPGNVTVARGGDLLIAARLRGFQSDAVDLLVRQRDSTNWTRLTMALDSAGKFAGRYTFRLFDIAAPMEYVIESNGVRSPAYRIDVADLPYAKQLGLQYRFPAYTGLAPQTVEAGGDIAAVKGTQVRVRVATTVPARGGRLLVDRGDRTDTIPLMPAADGSLGGTLSVMAAGFYKVELQAQDGRVVPGSLDYTIDALPDRPPTIHFSKPGSDQKVLSVDEVYTEVQADDDYGVAKMELVYSVNGGLEKTAPLYSATRRTPEMTAGYTFSLEDFKLQEGDVVSYYARATDNNAVSGPQTSTSDIYFMKVRPFEQDYKQNQGGAGGGGGANDDAGQLSEQQRQIIAGTFNTIRDKASKQQKELQEDLSILRVAQQKLRGQTGELARRIVDRGIAARDSNFAQIAAILNKAVPIMDTAEKQLAGGSAPGALSPEQRALQQLQRAEAVFKNVSVSMGGQGGGGAGGQQRAQDLADLFELNREKLRNQYESVQRGREQQQQQDQQIDETAEKLKQLASRLQQENERAQAKADSLGQRMGASGSSGGAAQRQLAQQAEDAARQLERLAREKAEQQRQEESSSQNSPSSSSGAQSSKSSQSSSGASASQQREQRALEEAARRLREAADAMRRSASGGASSQQSATDAATAQQRLDEARRLLDQQRTGRLERDVQDVLQSAKDLAKQEQGVSGEVGKLWDNANAQERSQQLQSLTDRKGQMADQLRDLKARMDRLSLDSRRENKDAASGLAEASKQMRDRKTEEKIRASQGAMRFSGPEYTKSLEQSIGGDLNDLQQRLEQVASAARNGADKPSDKEGQSQELDRARDLVRGMQSLDERMRDARGNRQAENGQQSQNGQQGRNGQQSQNGQQAQRGGQQGQAQGQGQNGQQRANGQQGGRQSQGQGQAQNGQSQSAGQPGQSGGTAQGGMRGGQNGGGRPGNENSASGGPPDGNALGQFGREMRERLSDAQALRRDLKRQGVDTRDLDRAIAGMQSLADDRQLADERTAADLRAQTLENLKSFEFMLRKQLGAPDDNRVLLGRSGDVPAAFKQYVEEYYKSLARKP
jgi:uncharacterized protein DUF4175